MPYVGYENLSTTVTLAFDEMGQHLINAGWELFYTTSATDKTYRSNGEDNLGPYVYLHIRISSTNIPTALYLHWTTVGSCLLSYASFNIYNNSTSYRFYGNKDFLFIGGDQFITGSINACIYLLTRAPDMMRKTIAAPIIGAASVTIELPDLNRVFLGYKYNVLGLQGEGQQEVTVTNINTGTNQVTLTGCTNSYSAGALFGEHILTVCGYQVGVSGMGNGLTYNRVGNTVPSVAVTVKGQLGGQGNAYAHNTDIQLEPACLVESSRSIGTLPIEYIQKIESTGQVLNNLIYNITSGLPVVISIPTSLSTNVLTDSAQNWPVNSLAGKICMFIPETGFCYSRFILSNTSNTLTFRLSIPSIVTITTQYGIVDSVYRVCSIPNNSASMVAINEIF